MATSPYDPAPPDSTGQGGKGGANTIKDSGEKNPREIKTNKVAQYAANFQYTNMKQQNRFMMFIGPVPAFYVRATSLPSIDNNPVTVDTINSDYKIKGKSRWQPINVTLYDPILVQPQAKGPSGAYLVYEWIDRYHHASGRSLFKTEDKDRMMRRYKQTITISYLGPPGPGSINGLLQDKWVLHGAFCSSVNWGQLDVSSDDLVLIDIEITYDWAEMLPPSVPLPF